jgi:hypothetical protein
MPMIAEALVEKLADWQPDGAGPHSFVAPLQNGWEIAIGADTAESLGCRANEVTVRRPAGPNPTAAELTQWPDRSAKRITGLLEPLKLIEVDAARSEAILRSDPPASRGSRVQYYELRLRGTHEAKLHRYQADRTGGRREAIPFALTHEAIAKLADDLIAD